MGMCVYVLGVEMSPEEKGWSPNHPPNILEWDLI